MQRDLRIFPFSRVYISEQREGKGKRIITYTLKSNTLINQVTKFYEFIILGSQVRTLPDDSKLHTGKDTLRKGLGRLCIRVLVTLLSLTPNRLRQRLLPVVNTLLLAFKEFRVRDYYFYSSFVRQQKIKLSSNDK